MGDLIAMMVDVCRGNFFRCFYKILGLKQKHAKVTTSRFFKTLETGQLKPNAPSLLH
jgi:hypothetical protein